MRISDWSSDVCSSDLALSAAFLRSSSTCSRPRCNIDAPTSDQAPCPGRATRTISQPRPERSMPASGTGPMASISISRTPANGPSGFVIRYSSRSEEHTSELQSLMPNSYYVLRLKKKNQVQQLNPNQPYYTI